METRLPYASHGERREENFVLGIISRCNQDKGIAARLRRADNPSTEYQSWEVLAGFGINLEKDVSRLPYATIAAQIAKSKSDENGSLRLGKAIANCYEDGRESDQAKAKLRRILACEDLPELCRILRQTFSLVSSRNKQPLDYIRLLKQLRRFPHAPEAVKAQWAQEFYGRSSSDDEQVDA